MPPAGCSAWEREVGADNEPDPVPAATLRFERGRVLLAIELRGRGSVTLAADSRMPW